MAQPPAAHCAKHRRRPKVATCGTCGNALCADCIVRTSVGIKCRACTGVKAVAAQAGASAPSRADGVTDARRKPWAFALVAGGVVVLAVAGYGLSNRGSGPATQAVPDDIPTASAAGFIERQSEFVGAGGQRLGGTLTLPGTGPGEGETVAAVLIVPGLGAVNRDSVTAAAPPDVIRDALVATVGGVPLGTGDPLYKDLSEALARAGVASFRYDRRGSTPVPVREGQKLSFDDEVADARAALDLLGKRQEVGVAPLAVLGHDTGGIVAMRLAAGNPRVKAVVAVSTPARPLVEVLAADLARSRGQAVADAFRGAASTLSSTGKSPPADTLPDILRPIFANGHDAYLAALLPVNPASEVGRVAQPVLLVRGGGDPSVTAADTERFSSSLRAGGQVIVAAADANHNLTLAGPGHEHSNVVTAPVSHRDADAANGLAAWVKLTLAG